MMAALALDTNLLYAGIALLTAVVVIFAIARGRSVKLWFRKAGLQVGEDKNAVTPKQGTGQNVSVANNSKISGSSFNVHVGNSVNYPAPGAGEENHRK
jgi:hypothetical protein